MSHPSTLPMESLTVSGYGQSSTNRSRPDLRGSSGQGMLASQAAYPASPTGWESARGLGELPGESEVLARSSRLPRSNKRLKKLEETMDESRKQTENRLRDFVSAHFHRKECRLFEQKEADKCACGEVRGKHCQDLLRTSTAEKWSPETCLLKVDGSTNAFGRITLKNEGFDNREPINFVRLCDEDDMDRILELMNNYWHMSKPQKPSLCISVIGGAKNFKLEGRKKEVFHHGLIRAAQTTNAWIITSGLNLGITRVVGNALEEGRESHWENSASSSKLRCIGVAPWGYVLDKDKLINKPISEKRPRELSLDVEYKISNVIGKGQPVSLNANHTHYLLIDDGKRNRYGGSKSGVIKAQLQRRINEKEDIPVVLLIVEGGFDIFDEMKSMIEASIPIVACDNTGRAADIIAFAYKKLHKSENKKLSDTNLDELRARMRVAFEENLRDPRTKEVSPAKLEENLQMLLGLVANEKLITVFDMNRSGDLDLAIMSALLKGLDANREQADYTRQLSLALTWNRPDIAAEKIFTEELQWDTSSLEEFTQLAIEQDKIEFVRLFLRNGLIMREFLTVGRLRELYRRCLSASSKNSAALQVWKLLTTKTPAKDAEKVTLSSIRLLLRRLIGKFKSADMKADTDSPASDIDTSKLERPFNQLFFWAVLFGRQAMARFLWERTDEAVPLALAACKLLDEMARSLPSHEDTGRRILGDCKLEFEDLALRVVEECQAVDPFKAGKLVEKSVEGFGGLNCLELAARANCKKFLAGNSSQSSVTTRWLNGLMHGTSNSHILACVLLPFLLASDRVIQVEPQKMKEIEEESGGGCCARAMGKARIFYTAPVTKFFGNAVWYMAYLVLYSYFILFGLRRNYLTWVEWLVMVWIWILIVDEIREMFLSSKVDSLRERIRDWWSLSVWNRLDLITILLTLLSMFMRIPGVTDSIFLGVRTCYILAGVFFYLRVFRLYYVNSYLGPKLVMINKMVRELLFYLSILLVPLLTFGISGQALRYPNTAFVPSALKNIVYYPYWQMFGQLFVEDLQSTPTGCTGNSSMDSSGNPCPTQNALFFIIMAVYLMVVNILLLNLLIAIFRCL